MKLFVILLFGGVVLIPKSKVFFWVGRNQYKSGYQQENWQWEFHQMVCVLDF